MTNPDFVALAKAMHVHAIRCDSLADLPAKMKEFMEYDNNLPILMDARVVKTEHVYPMVRSSSFSFARGELMGVVGRRSRLGRRWTRFSSTLR